MTTTRPAKRPSSGHRPISEYFNGKSLPASKFVNPNGKRACSGNSGKKQQEFHAPDVEPTNTSDRVMRDVIVVMTPSTESTLSDVTSSRLPSPSCVADSQEDLDTLRTDDSDGDLPSLDALIPSNSGKPKSKTRKPSIPSRPKRPPAEFLITEMLKEKEEMEKLQAKRAQLASLMDTDEEMDDFESDDSIVNDTTERVLGKERNNKVKDVLARLGADLREGGGYIFFRHKRQEREFDVSWIAKVEWLHGFEVEETRNPLVRCGFVKNMLALGEKLPLEVVQWSLEHVAFEKSEILAYAYSEIAVAVLNDSPDVLTCDALDQILLQFGADNDFLSDFSEMNTTKNDVDIEFNRYGLLSLASVLGQLPLSLKPNIRFHVIFILLKMSIDVQVGEELIETVEASVSSLLDSLDDAQVTYLISILVNNVPDLSLQCRILNRLPIQPSSAAIFRQSLAKAFLSIPADAPTSSLLSCLRSTYPFSEVKRDMSNEHARAIQYGIQIYDIAISKLPREQNELTGEIILALKDMHRRILDGGAAFMVRTETKEVIQRFRLRLESTLVKPRSQKESLDKYCA